MVKFAFTPSEKAFGKTEVLRTIDVNMEVDAGSASIMASINGKVLATSVVAHAAAFGIRQMLANSYASAGTAKNKDGGLLPMSERLALWQGNFDKVLNKMTDPATRRNWESVFTEGAARESADPVQVEINKIVRAKLVAWAAKKESKLPKADSDEYAALVKAVLDKQGPAIRASAESIVAARNAAASDDDMDLDLDGAGDESPAE